MKREDSKYWVLAAGLIFISLGAILDGSFIKMIALLAGVACIFFPTKIVKFMEKQLSK